MQGMRNAQGKVRLARILSRLTTAWQPLTGLGAEQALVRRHLLQLAGRALNNMPVGAIVEHHQLGELAGIVVGDVRRPTP